MATMLQADKNNCSPGCITGPLPSVQWYQKAVSKPDNGAPASIWDALKMLEAKIEQRSHDSAVEKLTNDNVELRSESEAVKRSHHKLNAENGELKKANEALTSQCSQLAEDMRVLRLMMRLTIASSDADNSARILFSDGGLLPERTNAPRVDSAANSSSGSPSDHSTGNEVPTTPARPARVTDNLRVDAFVAYLMKMFKDRNDHNLATDLEARQKVRRYALDMVRRLPPGDGRRQARIELAFWEGMDLHWVLSGKALDDLVKCREIYWIKT